MVAVGVKPAEYCFYLAYSLQSSDSDTATNRCETALCFQVSSSLPPPPPPTTKQLLKVPFGFSMENSKWLKISLRRFWFAACAEIGFGGSFFLVRFVLFPYTQV